MCVRTRPCLLYLLLTSLVASAAVETPVPVLFDHDGGVDDFITLLLLAAFPEKIKVMGITIVEGDCHADVAANTTLKLLHLLQQRRAIPVAVSTLSAVNPFPDHYRSQGLILDVLPVLNNLEASELADLRDRQLQKQPGQEVFAQLLLNHHQHEKKVTIIATGPLSNLAYALDKYPHVADRIERVWWMGGALRVRGNVYQPHTDGSAEWNAFWDPAALAVVWNSSVPLTLVPLDGTNKVPITPDLIYSFGPQAQHLYSSLAGTMYAPVVNWVYNTPGDPYYAWDALTAACMLDPTLCKLDHGLQVAAVLSGPAQGSTVLVDQQQQSTSAPAPPAQPNLPQQHQATIGRHTPPGPAADQQDASSLPVERLLLSSSQPVVHDAHGAGTRSSSSTSSSGTNSGMQAVGLYIDDDDDDDDGDTTAAATDVGVAQGAATPTASASVAATGGGSVVKVVPQLSVTKVVSAVMDVDAEEFQRFMLHTLRK